MPNGQYFRSTATVADDMSLGQRQKNAGFSGGLRAETAVGSSSSYEDATGNSVGEAMDEMIGWIAAVYVDSCNTIRKRKELGNKRFQCLVDVGNVSTNNSSLAKASQDITARNQTQKQTTCSMFWKSESRYIYRAVSKYGIQLTQVPDVDVQECIQSLQDIDGIHVCETSTLQGINIYHIRMLLY